MAALNDGGFQGPAVILEGLTEEQAFAKPHGLTHSIADIVAHICFWQEFFNGAAVEGFSGFPAKASEGWPATPEGGWEALRERFLQAVQTAANLARSEPLDGKLIPAEVPLPFWRRESIGTGLLHGAMHSAHHLGQIVTIRQLLKLWPPKAGSMTW